MTIGIKSGSANKPVGDFLATKIVNVATLSSSAQWTGGDLDTALTITSSGAEYHVLIKLDSGATVTSSNCVRWYRDDEDSYANGFMDVSVNTGVDWSANSNFDFAFKVQKPLSVVIDYPKISTALAMPNKIYEDVRLSTGGTKRYEVGIKRHWVVEAHFDASTDEIGATSITDLDALLAFEGELTLDEEVWEGKSYTILIDDGSGKRPETEKLKKVVYDLKMTEV